MKKPKVDKSLLGRFRDRLAWLVISAGMYLATPWYRAMIEGAIRLGLDAATVPEAYAKIIKERKRP